MYSHLHADHIGGFRSSHHAALAGPDAAQSMFHGRWDSKPTWEATPHGHLPGTTLLALCGGGWPGKEAICLWDAPASESGVCFAARGSNELISLCGIAVLAERRVDGAWVQSLGLSGADPSQLREKAPSTGQRSRLTWDDITLPPPPPRSYAYCSDTVYDKRLVEYVNGTTMLYHEATFLSSQQERARQTFHATAQEAARTAEAAGVQTLLIGHFSARYKDPLPLLREAQATFPKTLLAEEGKTYIIDHA